MTDQDPNFHPTGQPNRTPVNASNPIFGIPADPVPDVSIGQAAIAQNAVDPGPTVISPLINEGVEDASPAPVADPEPEPASEVEPCSEPKPPEPSTEEGEDQSDGSNAPATGLPSAEDLDAVAAEAPVSSDPGVGEDVPQDSQVPNNAPAEG